MNECTKIARKRKMLLEALRADNNVLQAHREIYKQDYIKFINDWFITYDPRQKPSLLPFILFPRQIEMIQFLQDRIKNKENGLIEKSRDMGASWICIALAICMWLFDSGSKIAFGSWKQDKIDRIGDNDSLFEKGRMILRYLPIEFIPQGYDEKKHATFLKFINPENGSTITGEAGDQIGRGGRSAIYIKDEAAFYEHADAVEAALSQNTDVQIDLSTPNGNGNLFAQKRMSGKVPVFTFHWKDDPRKGEDWYETQKRKYSPLIIAREIDIDYNASVEGICIPNKYIQAAIDFDCPGITTGNKRAGLDVADEGNDANSLCIVEGVKVTSIESWYEGNTTQTTRKAFNICRDKKIEILRFDNIGVGAGVKGESSSLLENGEYNIEVYGVHSGGEVTSDDIEEDKSNKDMFLNLRAEMWWVLRKRFIKTWEHVNKVKTYPVDELISIPNDGELITELSQPKYAFSQNGKIKIEAKADMRKRGIKSPNKADSLCLCFVNAGEMVAEDFSLNDIDYNQGNRRSWND